MMTLEAPSKSTSNYRGMSNEASTKTCLTNFLRTQRVTMMMMTSTRGSTTRRTQLQINSISSPCHNFLRELSLRCHRMQEKMSLSLYLRSSLSVQNLRNLELSQISMEIKRLYKRKKSRWLITTHLISHLLSKRAQRPKICASKCQKKP